MKHITESNLAIEFLAKVGVVIHRQQAAHNSITLVNHATGETLTLVAESDIGIALGIPGIYIEDQS